MSLSASAKPSEPVLLLRYFDVAVVVLAAPIMLLIGVPALGYAIGAGAWLALRAVCVAVERTADASEDARKQIAARGRGSERAVQEATDAAVAEIERLVNAKVAEAGA